MARRPVVGARVSPAAYAALDRQAKAAGQGISERAARLLEAAIFDSEGVDTAQLERDVSVQIVAQVVNEALFSMEARLQGQLTENMQATPATSVRSKRRPKITKTNIDDEQTSAQEARHLIFDKYK